MAGGHIPKVGVPGTPEAAKSDFRRQTASGAMSEYQVKLEAIGEYQDALRYKKMNEELCNSLLGLLGQLSRHYEKKGMDLPVEVSRIMEKASEVLDARIDSSKRASPA
jgi:hypothetical protein